MKNFKNVTQAFEFYYDKINNEGIEVSNTKALYNEMFIIEDISEKVITTPWRKFNEDYAQTEWLWYLSGNRNASEISKVAKIWKNHMDVNGNVNSNYGWQWMRSKQLHYVINELLRDKYSRRALITLYDGKEHNQYQFDTPCTLNIQFFFKPNDERLHMTVMMRSNDLWYGFSNDAYTFMKLQEMVSDALKVQTGTYTHIANNLHLYSNFLNRK